MRQLPEQCKCCKKQITTLETCVLPDGTRKRGVEFTFRQGDQEVTVASGADDSYCMEAPGGATERFRSTQDIGKPEPGGCPVGG